MSKNETKMKPATPLPWNNYIDAMIGKVDAAVTKTEYRKAESEIAGFVQGNAAYIVHACNAYPELVAALKRVEFKDRESAKIALDLLRKLGEG